MIEAITAPGPSSGERIGIEQMNDKITRPMMLLASARQAAGDPVADAGAGDQADQE